MQTETTQENLEEAQENQVTLLNYSVEKEGESFSFKSDQGKTNFQPQNTYQKRLLNLASFHGKLWGPQKEEELSIEDIEIMLWDQNWRATEEAFSEKREVKGKVIGFVRDGLVVDIGIRAMVQSRDFLLYGVFNRDQVLGKEFTFNVLRLYDKRGFALLTRKSFLKDDFVTSQNKAIKKVKNETILKGEIAFHDRGQAVVLCENNLVVHVPFNKLSYAWVENFWEEYPRGKKVSLKLSEKPSESGKVLGSIRGAHKWKWNQKSFPLKVSQHVKARVTKLADNGAQLAIDYKGNLLGAFLPISENSWNEDEQKNPELGAEIEVSIYRLNFEKRGVFASLRRLDTAAFEPYLKLKENSEKVTGNFESKNNMGIVVKFNDGMNGFLPYHNLSWHSLLASDIEISEEEPIEAFIEDVDMDRGRIRLSLCEYENPYQFLMSANFKTMVLNGNMEQVGSSWFYYIPEHDIYAELLLPKIKEGLRDKKYKELSKGSFDVMVESFDRKSRVLKVSIEKFEKNHERLAMDSYNANQVALTQSLGIDED